MELARTKRTNKNELLDILLIILFRWLVKCKKNWKGGVRFRMVKVFYTWNDMEKEGCVRLVE